MKKILAALCATFLLAGCFGSGPSAEEDTLPVDESGNIIVDEEINTEQENPETAEGDVVGDGAEGTEDTSETDSTNTAGELTEEKFIELSAKILCLPANNLSATPEEIEKMAQRILEDDNITEEKFTMFQEGIESDAEKKSSLSLLIISKMNDFCSIGAEQTEPTEEVVVVEEEAELVEEENDITDAGVVE